MDSLTLPRASWATRNSPIKANWKRRATSICSSSAVDSNAVAATNLHTVQVGESIAEIAAKHNVSVRAIKELNYGHRSILKGDHVAPGHRLQIPVQGEQQLVTGVTAVGSSAAAAAAAPVWLLQAAGLGLLAAGVWRFTVQARTPAEEAAAAHAAIVEAQLSAVSSHNAAVSTLLQDAREEIMHAEAQLSQVAEVKTVLKQRQMQAAQVIAQFKAKQAEQLALAGGTRTEARTTTAPVAGSTGVLPPGVLPVPGQGMEDAPATESMAGVVEALNRSWKQPGAGGSGAGSGGKGTAPVTDPWVTTTDDEEDKEEEKEVKAEPAAAAAAEVAAPAEADVPAVASLQNVEAVAPVAAVPAVEAVAPAIEDAAPPVEEVVVEQVAPAVEAVAPTVEEVVAAAAPAPAIEEEVEAAEAVEASTTTPTEQVAAPAPLTPAAEQQPEGTLPITPVEAPAEPTQVAVIPQWKRDLSFVLTSLLPDEPSAETAVKKSRKRATASQPGAPPMLGTKPPPAMLGTTPPFALLENKETWHTVSFDDVDEFEAGAQAAAAADRAVIDATQQPSSPAAPAAPGSDGVLAVDGELVAAVEAGPLSEVSQEAAAVMLAVEEEASVAQVEEDVAPTVHAVEEATAAAVHAVEDARAAAVHAVEEVTVAAVHAVEEATVAAVHAVADAAAPVVHAVEEAAAPVADMLQEAGDVAAQALQEVAKVEAAETAAPAEEAPPEPEPLFTYPETIVGMKAALFDVVYATQRGATSTLEERARAEELISVLECRNPNTRPSECLRVLDGTWKLVYTSSPQTLLLLSALNSLPLVELGDVVQHVDITTMTAHNKIEIKVPVPLTLRAETSMEVRTPHALKVRLTRVGLETFIQTPQVLAALDMPQSLDLWGTELDLSPVRRYVVDPFNAVLETSKNLISRAVSPDLDVQAMESTSTWMLTTYLDETLRVTRCDDGHVFVMLKEVQEQ